MGRHGIQYYWFAYVRKAFAKYHGSYHSLSWGRGREALMCLTGDPAEFRGVSQISREKLRGYIKEKYCITVGISKHVYVVIKIVGSTVHLFNPYNINYKHLHWFQMRQYGGKAGEHKGMVTLSWTNFQQTYSPGSLSICWTGKYTQKRRKPKYWPWQRRGGYRY